MFLIVGLGNPGQKYKNTRHNVGFMAIDQLVGDFKFDKKFNAEVRKSEVGSRKSETIFAKPQTFVNLSGQAVQSIMSYYKIPPENLIVIHDDLDIALGEFKIQKNRSSAGHNGVQSIIDQIGTKNFTRVRIGIKPNFQTNSKLKVKSSKLMPDSRFQIPDTKYNIPAEKFVLEKFNKEELEIIKKVIDDALKRL